MENGNYKVFFNPSSSFLRNVGKKLNFLCKTKVMRNKFFFVQTHRGAFSRGIGIKEKKNLQIHFIKFKSVFYFKEKLNQSYDKMNYSV